MANNKAPDYGETFIMHFVDSIKARPGEIKSKMHQQAVHQADVMTRGLRPVAQANGSYSYRSGGAQYPYGLSNQGRSLTINHSRMRLNARDAYHDSPQARSVIDRFADTVAGTGLVRESSPLASVLGITPEAAKAWARDVDGRFDLFCRDKRQHRSEGLTFYQMQRLYQVFQHRDNDIYVRLYYSNDKSLQNPLQWEFNDPDQIMGCGSTSTSGEYPLSMFDGIVRDERGREVAYDVLTRGADGRYKTVRVMRKGPKSERLFMLHGYTPEYAGQGRGYSRLGFALQALENITDFSSAQIKKAIMQSSIVAMMENKDLDPSNVFEAALTKFGNGAAAKAFGSNPETETSTAAIDDEPTRCYQIPEATFDAPGVFVMNARRGDSLKPFAQNAPADSYDKFVDAFMYYLSSGAGIPLEVVLMRFNQNYSASRGTLILFWRVVMQWRDEFAADCGNPIFEMWLAGEIAAGRISAPGWLDPVLRAAWLHGTWRGAPIPDIDPNKTAKARRENLSLGLTTGAREAKDLNGSEFESNVMQLEHEFGERPPAPWSKSGGSDTSDMATAIADELDIRMEDNKNA